MKHALHAELRRFMEKLRHEPFSMLPVLGFLYAFFWILTFSIRMAGLDASTTTQSIAHSMLGYILWFFTISVIGNIPQTLQEERTQGTYEQLHLSVTGINAICIARSIINSITNIILIIAFVGIVMLFHSIRLFNIPAGICILMCVLPGLYGFAFLLAALLLRFRQSGSWLGILNFIILVPLLINRSVLSERMAHMLSYWPVYQASCILRHIHIDELSLYALRNDIYTLLCASAVFFVLGIGAFS